MANSWYLKTQNRVYKWQIECNETDDSMSLMCYELFLKEQIVSLHRAKGTSIKTQKMIYKKQIEFQENDVSMSLKCY